MQKSLYTALFLLSSMVMGDTIQTLVKIEPSALVSFDQSFVTGNPLQDNTLSFESVQIDVDMNLGTKFEMTKNIYVKTNTSTPLTMALKTLGDTYGKLTKGPDSIRVDYQLMGNDYTNFDGTDARTLTSTPLDGTGSEVGTFYFKQHYDTSADQEAGEYTASFEVILSAS